MIRRGCFAIGQSADSAIRGFRHGSDRWALIVAGLFECATTRRLRVRHAVLRGVQQLFEFLHTRSLYQDVTPLFAVGAFTRSANVPSRSAILKGLHRRGRSAKSAGSAPVL